MRRVETAEQMCDAVRSALATADVLIMAAAVADFRPLQPAGSKVKKRPGWAPVLQLESAPDILATTQDARRPGTVTVGYALETDDVLANGRRKLTAKRLDLLVVNDATEPGAGFEVETNRVTLLAPDVADESLPLLSKQEVADHVLDRVELLLA